MSDVLAIVPARSGSKGIPNKNFTLLAGKAPVVRAYDCAVAAGIEHVVVSTDRCSPGSPLLCGGIPDGHFLPHSALLYAGPPLHTDTCPMIDVVKDVLARVPGEPDQKVILLQPTQPLRKPEHVTQALELLTPEWTSVVSVIETVSPDELLTIWGDGTIGPHSRTSLFRDIPPRRQDMQRGFKRDGTAYAFWRSTVDGCDGIYGHSPKALIIDPADTCPLDTIQDWYEAERRLRARHAQDATELHWSPHD